MQLSTKTTYKYTNKPYEAVRWLRELPSLVACDFETASMYSDEEKIVLREELEALSNQGSLYSHQLRQKINSDGLSHPALSVITHVSIAWSETESLIIITDTKRMRDIVYNWLVTTDCKQVWHNLSFDAKHIYYHTKRFPKDYEDTAILAKTILNHVDVYKSKVGLKILMGYKYGSWAVAADSFNLSRMYDEDVIEYAGIDACATMALWNEMQYHLKEQYAETDTVGTVTH